VKNVEDPHNRPFASRSANIGCSPKTAEPWSLTSLREKMIKIGAKVWSTMAATSPSSAPKWQCRNR
jgi:hypothetical protein